MFGDTYNSQKENASIIYLGLTSSSAFMAGLDFTEEVLWT